MEKKPKFKYGQKVIVNDGFYENEIGKIDDWEKGCFAVFYHVVLEKGPEIKCIEEELKIYTN